MNAFRALIACLGLACARGAGAGASLLSEPESVTTPDAPVAFGCKAGWFAIKTLEVAAVEKGFGRRESRVSRRPANESPRIDRVGDVVTSFQLD
jgi:hypothetical protein